MTSAKWGALWALLCDRFPGEKKSVEIGAFYFAELTARLTDAEVAEGVRRVLYGGRFFPSPAEIVLAARPQSATEGLVEWELCLRVMEGSSVALAQLSPLGQRIVRLLGGPERLRLTPIDSVPFVRKHWLELYENAQEVEAMTPPGLRAGDDTPLLPPGPMVVYDRDGRRIDPASGLPVEDAPTLRLVGGT